MADDEDDIIKVTLQWADGVVPFPAVEDSDCDTLDEHGFYALLAADKDHSGEYYNLKLLYIGLACAQTLRKRLWQEHTSFAAIEDHLNEDDQNLVVMLATIVESTHEPSRKLYEYIEGYLIAFNEPPMNSKKVNGYKGPAIRVLNTGSYDPLHEHGEIS